MKRTKKATHVFRVRAGFRVSKEAAHCVGQVIVTLAEGRGYSPKALVDAARDPRSPAHRFFEWDDTRAAERWRLEQAKLYHRAIEYEIVIRRAKVKPLRVNMRCAYPVADAEGKRRYASGGAVVRNGDLMKQVTDRALAQLEHWRDQWEHLRSVAKLAGVFSAIDEVIAKEKKRAA